MAQDGSDSGAPVPEGSRVLHIGSHKTGTTALQWAFHNARSGLAEHGVTYAGKERRPWRAASAAIGRVPADGPIPYAEWEELAAEVRNSSASRVVVSSEWFTDATEERIPTLVEDLGGSSVHVVVTVRALASVMPSQWQQEVQAGLRMAYDTWLDRIFTKPLYGKPTPMFWWRHQHDQLVERWAKVVGPERVTVVVIDDSDRQAMFRTFESLLALPTGLLESSPGDGNRSLTYGEVELIRELNNRVHKDANDSRTSARQMRRSVTKRMIAEKPSEHEIRVPTPAWGAEKCAAIGKDIAANLESLGVRVIGDLGQLSAVRETPGNDPLPPPMISAAQASNAVLGAPTPSERASRSGTARAEGQRPRRDRAAATKQDGKRPRKRVERDPFADATAAQLLRIVGARALRRVRRLRRR